MERGEPRIHRLFTAAPLAHGAEIAASREQANYLLNVLRLGPGGRVALFNGRDGEWQGELRLAGRKAAMLVPLRQTRAQTAADGPWFLFAPLKHARLDYMVQKAVELGASRLVPVLTRHTQVARVNLERMRANAIEAAEQCGALAVAQVAEPRSLDALLAGWDASRQIVFCDEAARGDPLVALAAIGAREFAVLVGPEGGFSGEERERLRALPHVTAIGLGPRILRADTAAVAALALAQTALGDWRQG
jgi:16S rRNA (uracil1498-N3)-methyltransferase